MAASSTIYSGIKSPTDVQPTFFQQFKAMGKRVFQLSKCPVKYEAVIINYSTDHLGTYVPYILKSEERIPYSIDPKDWYVSLKITPIKEKTTPFLEKLEAILKKIFFFLQPSSRISKTLELPSRLFFGAKTNDSVSFTYKENPSEKDTLYELHLREDFEGKFQSLEQLMKQKDIVEWSKAHPGQKYPSLEATTKDLQKDLPNLFSDATIYVGNQLVPQSDELKREIEEIYNKSEKFGLVLHKENDQYHIDLYNAIIHIEDIKTVIQGQSMLIVGKREIPTSEDAQIFYDDIPRTLFHFCSFDKPIDSSTIELVQQEHGVVRISFKLKQTLYPVL